MEQNARHYCGLVVIKNDVVSKLGMDALPTLVAPPFPAAPITPTAPLLLTLDAA